MAGRFGAGDGLMARIRTIKPEFFNSQDIENLPRLTARITFAGIWTQADDEGRLRYDDPRVLKGAIWPLADWHTAEDVAEDVACLVEAGLLIHYTVTEDSRSLPGVLSERSFLFVTKWKEHQKINRPTPSKLPAPEDGEIRGLTCTVANRVSRYGRAHGGFTEDSPQEVEVEVEREVEVEPGTTYPDARAGARRGGGSSERVVAAVADELELDLGLPLPPDPKPDDEEPAITAQTITARWVDACRSIGAPPDKTAIGKVARQAKQLLDAKADPERLLAAAWSCGEQGYDDVGKELRLMNGRRRSPLDGRVNGVRPSHTDARMAHGLGVLAELAEEDAAAAAAQTPKEITR